MRRLRRALLRLPILLALAVAALAAPRPAEASEAEAWAALERPGAVALMRHALAPGTGDPADFALGDCATQRNLSERGREQARRVGEGLRARGVGFDRVLTSEWCRCRETADLLGLGRPEPLSALNSFFGRYAERDTRTEAARAFLAAQPPESRLLLVTHQVNISALVGTGARSGEVVVARRGADGSLTPVGSIRIDP
ncbi:MAG: histidine phosphatase family protein [Paracoccaceae bacterium]